MNSTPNPEALAPQARALLYPPPQGVIVKVWRGTPLETVRVLVENGSHRPVDATFLGRQLMRAGMLVDTSGAGPGLYARAVCTVNEPGRRYLAGILSGLPIPAAG